MSQDQNAMTHSGPPRRFLRKGEGLKRFAAYRPPLPSTVKKVERRQTFVRFKLDPLASSNTNRGPPSHFLPPEILNDDSINLSTEIPRIAPPKIIHTPIRPNRQALGTLTNETSVYINSHINNNIDLLLKKIEEKKSTLEENPQGNQFDQNHDDFTPPNSPIQEQPPKARKTVPTYTIQSPASKSKGCILALDKQIQQIESIVNELKEKIKACECGNNATSQQSTTRRRPTTRAAARQAAQSKASDTKNRPSADADNQTAKVFNSLMSEVAELRAKFDEFNLNV